MKRIKDLRAGDLLSMEQAAELLSVTKKCLYKWSYKAKTEPDKYPRALKIGGNVRFLKSDLIEFLNRQFDKAS